MTRRARRAGATALLIAIIAPFGLATMTATALAAPTPRPSLTDIENDLMCTECHEPLPVAQSLEADSERSYIRMLIADGETKSQILKNMVAQYGTAVLAKPPAHGFNLTVYVIPLAILAAGATIVAVTLPRWRRRTRAAVRAPTPDAPALDPTDAQRLEQELSRFGG